MTSQQQTWHQSAKQQTRLEYATLKQQCPEGIYATIKPGNPLQWSGVLFVRKGPYSPAILRFQVYFPIEYPTLPPTITFFTDVFHPLVTPLTTYTYSTGAAGSDTVSASDEERLPPGSFSLRHGFPGWFGRQRFRSRSTTAIAESARSDSPSPSSSKLAAANAGREASTKSPPAEVFPSPSTHQRSAVNPGRSNSTIIQVFEYMRRSFTEESFLDTVPLEAAGNAGAWRAWRAHRASYGVDLEQNLEVGKSAEQGTEWNWDGVWEQRVRRGIDSSVSDGVLFGASSSDEMPRFLDLDDDLLKKIQSQILAS